MEATSSLAAAAAARSRHLRGWDEVDDKRDEVKDAGGFLQVATAEVRHGTAKDM
jgi:hypothetical protein